MLGGLRLRTSVRALTTGVFATGTVWWWAAAVGSTWYLAHLVAVDIALVAVGIALRQDPTAADERPWDEAARGDGHPAAPAGGRLAPRGCGRCGRCGPWTAPRSSSGSCSASRSPPGCR